MIICPWKEIRRYAGAIPGLEEAVAAIEGMKTLEVGTYPLSNDGKIVVNDIAVTKAGEGRALEAHRNFLDIQYVVEGEEYMSWAPVDELTVSTEYDPAKDRSMHAGNCQFFRIPAGYCYIVFPEDAHGPGVHLDGKQTEERKILVKLKV